MRWQLKTNRLFLFHVFFLIQSADKGIKAAGWWVKVGKRWENHPNEDKSGTHAVSHSNSPSGLSQVDKKQIITMTLHSKTPLNPKQRSWDQSKGKSLPFLSSWDREGAQNPISPTLPQTSGWYTPLYQHWDFPPHSNLLGVFLAVAGAVLGFLQMVFLHWATSPLFFFTFCDFFLPLSGTGSAKAQSCLSTCQLLSAKKGGALLSLACRWGHDVLGHLLHHLIAPISGPFFFSTQALGREARKIKALQKRASLHGSTKGEIG